MELEDLLAQNDGVAGVVAALIANDRRDVLGQSVGRLAFALVAPLQADNYGGGHLFLPRVLAPAVVREVTPGNQKALGRLAGDLGRLPLRRSRGSCRSEGGGSSHGANSTPSWGNVASLAMSSLEPGGAGPRAVGSIAGERPPAGAVSERGHEQSGGRSTPFREQWNVLGRTPPRPPRPAPRGRVPATP